MPAKPEFGWYDFQWQKRIPISIDATATASGGTVNIDLTIPRSASFFWSNVQADGFDAVLTESDGITEISAANANASAWDLGSTFNTTTRIGSVRVDGLLASPPTTDPILFGEHNHIWMYFHKSVTETSDHRFGVYAGPSTETALWPREHPKRARPRMRIGPQPLGAEVAELAVAKASAEDCVIWVDFSRDLSQRRGTFQGRRQVDGIQSVAVTSEEGGTTSLVVDTNFALWLDETTVGVKLSGGSDGLDYVVIITAKTHRGNILDRRFRVLVRDVTEAP